MDLKTDWVKVPGWRCCVTKDGQVASLNRRGQKAFIRSPTIKRGYFKLPVFDESLGRWRNTSVHRLVALAFLGVPEQVLEVDHLNGVRTDNRIENLRWVTHRQNLEFTWARLGWNPKQPKRPRKIKRRIAASLCYEKPLADWVVFDSLVEAAQFFERPYETFAPTVCNALGQKRRRFRYWWKRVE
jgi:hypothetical protein